MRVITAIHLVGGSGHEHIAEVRWTNAATAQTGHSSREEMVSYLRAGNRAEVHAAGRAVEVRVVNANPPYIRTYADGIWTDNLLALPRY